MKMKKVFRIIKTWFKILFLLFCLISNRQVVNDIDGDGDDDADESGEGIKYYLNTVLI